MARLDPLVEFGTIGSHVHAIHGSNGKFNPTCFVIA